MPKKKEVKKKEAPKEVEKVVVPELPVQCPRCGNKGHEPNQDCDAGK